MNHRLNRVTTVNGIACSPLLSTLLGPLFPKRHRYSTQKHKHVRLGFLSGIGTFSVSVTLFPDFRVI